jgi:hypothetical protein
MKDAIILLARRALPLMNPTHRAEAVLLLNSFERTANAGTDELQEFYTRSAAAWEADMRPLTNALVAALHMGDLDAFAGFRKDLPKLLDQVNADPALASVLTRQLFRVFASTIDETHAASSGPAAPFTANAATPSLEQWRGRTAFPTEFGSAELRGFSSELHLRSIFSARTTNADYLNEVGKVVDDLLSGKTNIATGRLQLMRKLKQLGYDVEKGFPQDMANVPPAEKGSLQDLSSERRIDLMLKTNVAITRNYGRVVEGNTDFARYAFPAWELVRLEHRNTPRGSPDSHTDGWMKRWEAAGESVGWVGAHSTGSGSSTGGMIALKDSPIWTALADGAGGYTDTLGHPFPPFAFNSGYDWRAVPRVECISLELIGDGSSKIGDRKQETGPMKAQLAPTQDEEDAAFARLSPDLLKALEESWAA